MTQETVLLLHGFASSGNSTKAQYLRERFKALPNVDFHAVDFNPTPRDFEYMTVTGMINRLRQYVLDHDFQRVFIVGSSMGALVGLNKVELIELDADHQVNDHLDFIWELLLAALS